MEYDANIAPMYKMVGNHQKHTQFVLSKKK
jgi:hypothetical protein